jgi:hypothetical protein
MTKVSSEISERQPGFHLFKTMLKPNCYSDRRFAGKIMTGDIYLQRFTRIKAFNYYSQKYLYLNSVLVYQRARGKGQDFGARRVLPKALKTVTAAETSM